MALSMDEVNKKYGILGSGSSPTNRSDLADKSSLDPRYQTGGDAPDGGAKSSPANLLAAEKAAAERRKVTGVGKEGSLDLTTDVDTGVGRYTEKEDPVAQMDKTEEEIKEEMAKKAQKAIDAINEEYAISLEKEEVRGEGRMGQTRAMASRAGLMGAPMGASQLAKTEAFNVQEEERIAAERRNEILKVREAYDQRAEEKLAAEREYAFKTREIQEQERAEYIERGIQLMSDLAKTGESWENVDQDIRDEILTNTGMSPLAARLNYNARLDKDKQVDLQYEQLSDGSYMFWGQDPQTGELVQYKYEYEVPEGEELKIIDNVPYFISKNEDGETILKPAEGYVEDPIEKYKRELEAEEAELGLYGKTQELAKSALEIEREKATMGLDIQEQKLEIDKLYKEIQEIGKTDPIEAAMKYEQLKQLQAKNAASQKELDDISLQQDNELEYAETKLGEIDDILNHSGFSDAIGTFPLGRISFDEWFTADKANFIAAIDLLLSEETMDTLLQLKNRGGTLGALSDAELQMLKSAASKFGSESVRVKDDDGNTVGFRMSENDAKKELQRIRNQHQKLVDHIKELKAKEVKGLYDDFYGEETEIDDADASIFYE